jgi:urease accessory protein
MTALLRLLHLCDSLFPIGSFAYSDGLEAAVAGGHVSGQNGLVDWLETCRDEGFGRTDGPAMAIAWSALERDDWEAIVAVDQEVTALRPSAATRTASRSMGSRLVKVWQGLHPDVRLERIEALARADRLGPTLPVAFAAVSFCAGIVCRDAMAGYAYTRLAATMSAAMRLVALGQTDAHQMLSRELAQVPATIDEVFARRARPDSFTPSLDIAQMTQQYGHARLFRS